MTIGACAAMSAGITWALASDMVVLYPATLHLTVNLASENITKVTALAYLPVATPIERTVTSLGGGGPHDIDLTVDGGNPDDASDSGLAYRPAIFAYLDNTSNYLYIQKNTDVIVDNSQGTPSASVTATFNYPTTYRANAVVTVVGGTLSSLMVQAQATNAQLDEDYRAFTTSDFPTSTTTSSTTTIGLPMVRNNNVSVYATAWVEASDGTESQWQLASQTADLSQSSADVHWTIDLTGMGTLEGAIALVAPPTPTAIPTDYIVLYQGASSSTYGTHGAVRVTAGPSSTSGASYTTQLPPGDYDVSLVTYLAPPLQWFETKMERVTIVAGQTLIKNFTNGLAVGHLGLAVGGFFSQPDLSAAWSYVRESESGHFAYASQPTNSEFAHTLSAGTWKPYYTALSLNNHPDPFNQPLTLNTQIYKIPYGDTAILSTTVNAGNNNISLGNQTFTLVKSNIYFDVIETAGAPAIDVTSPAINAYRYDYNTDGSIKSKTEISALGFTGSLPVSGLTMVAEPGEYTIAASAYVNGTFTRFAGDSITFGEPVTTPSGSNVDVTLTPVQNPDLRVSLQFTNVTTPGITTVVETPLGPAPPEGLRTFCADNADGVTCPPIYYDISSTAPFQGPVTVCVRRLVTGVPNGAVDFLHLYHYNENLPGQDKWEELLPPPSPGVAALDCGSEYPAPAACGCDPVTNCGINLDADIPTNAFLVCGVTTSFSPFAILEGPIKFSNVVNGQEYTGPTGPPSLQQWTVPGTGNYRITATGAQGASGTSSPALAGGCGAEVSGDFALHEGDILQLLVGQKGTAAASNAGGGGGTFVIKNGAPLVIAGGGGGVRSASTVNGRSGTISTSGTAGSTAVNYASGFISGGTNGAGGSRAAGFGGGGGGWSGNGASDGTNGEGGFSFLGANRGKGGSGTGCGVPAYGGYGGGGAGNGCFGGGGGGGYSGGGGGRVAGGGGSLNNGLNPAGRENACTPKGHGLVSITLLPD